MSDSNPITPPFMLLWTNECRKAMKRSGFAVLLCLRKAKWM